MKRTSKKDKRSADVLLGVWIDPKLRERGQAAIKLCGYGDMKKFIESKLREAIQKAGLEIQPSA